jgi:hypothetical protein
MVLVGRLDDMNGGKDAQGKLENDSRQPRDLLKMGKVMTHMEETTYSFQRDDENVRCC